MTIALALWWFAEVTMPGGGLTGWGPFDSEELCWTSLEAYVSVIERAGPEPIRLECVGRVRWEP